MTDVLILQLAHFFCCQNLKQIVSDLFKILLIAVQH